MKTEPNSKFMTLFSQHRWRWRRRLQPTPDPSRLERKMEIPPSELSLLSHMRIRPRANRVRTHQYSKFQIISLHKYFKILDSAVWLPARGRSSGFGMKFWKLKWPEASAAAEHSHEERDRCLSVCLGSLENRCQAKLSLSRRMSVNMHKYYQ